MKYRSWSLSSTPARKCRSSDGSMRQPPGCLPLDSTFIPIRMLGAKMVQEHFAGAGEHAARDLQPLSPGFLPEHGRHAVTEELDAMRKNFRAVHEIQYTT